MIKKMRLCIFSLAIGGALPIFAAHPQHHLFPNLSPFQHSDADVEELKKASEKKGAEEETIQAARFFSDAVNHPDQFKHVKACVLSQNFDVNYRDFMTTPLEDVLRPGYFSKDLDTRLIYDGGHRNEKLIKYRKKIFPLLLARGGQEFAQKAVHAIKKEIERCHEDIGKSGLPENDWRTLKDKEFGVLYQEFLEMIEPYLKSMETKRVLEKFGVFPEAMVIDVIQSFIIAPQVVVSASTASAAAPKEPNDP